MSVTKAEIKILTAQSIAAQLSADLRNADTLIAEAKGGEKAMTGVMVALASVMAAAKQDLDDNNVSVEDVKLLRRYISRMQQAVADVAKQQESGRLVAEGISRGIGQAKARVQKVESLERAKLDDDDDAVTPVDAKRPATRRVGKKPEPAEHTTRDKAPPKKKRGPGRPRKVKPEDGRKNT